MLYIKLLVVIVYAVLWWISHTRWMRPGLIGKVMSTKQRFEMAKVSLWLRFGCKIRVYHNGMSIALYPFNWGLKSELGYTSFGELGWNFNLGPVMICRR